MSETAHNDGRHERWLSMTLSVLVHGGVLALLVWGWWRFRTPAATPPQPLAIEATLVTDRSTTVAPVAAAVSPAATPPVPTAVPATVPNPAPVATPVPDVQQQEQEKQRVKEQKEREREREIAKEKETEQAQQKAQARKLKEVADRAATEKTKRESELRTQLAAEERVNAARGGAEEAAWVSLIRDRVSRAWIRPPSVRAGVNCEVNVTQVPGGVVTGVQIGSCNGDQAVRESIEAAVYRASPLPAPSNPDLFDRNIKFNFRPGE